LKAGEVIAPKWLNRGIRAAIFYLMVNNEGKQRHTSRHGAVSAASAAVVPPQNIRDVHVAEPF
jgi:hypothetical protein